MILVGGGCSSKRIECFKARTICASISGTDSILTKNIKHDLLILPKNYRTSNHSRKEIGKGLDGSTFQRTNLTSQIGLRHYCGGCCSCARPCHVVLAREGFCEGLIEWGLDGCFFGRKRIGKKRGGETGQDTCESEYVCRCMCR